MTDAFKELLSGMNDHEINALDKTSMDDNARESLAIEVANRNRANEMKEIEEAIERGSSVQEGNAAPKKFGILAFIAALVLAAWFFI
jgi:hypothetical protein